MGKSNVKIQKKIYYSNPGASTKNEYIEKISKENGTYLEKVGEINTYEEIQNSGETNITEMWLEKIQEQHRNPKAINKDKWVTGDLTTIPKSINELSTVAENIKSTIKESIKKETEELKNENRKKEKEIKQKEINKSTTSGNRDATKEGTGKSNQEGENK